MKKKFYVFVLIIFIFSLLLHSKDSFSISVGGNLLMPADSNYSEIFGSTFMPQIKVKVKVYGQIYIFGGYSFINSKGEIAGLDVKDEAQASQNFLNFGAGITTGKKLILYLEGGVTMVSWKEDAFASHNSGNATGFNIEGGVNLKLGKTVFINLNLGLISVKDNSEDNGEIIPLSLGGIKSGLGFGVCF
jgi:hypothetical protein